MRGEVNVGREVRNSRHSGNASDKMLDRSCLRYTRDNCHCFVSRAGA
jgi:hypothetical protein